MVMEFIGGVRVRQCVQAGRPLNATPCCDALLNLLHDPDCDSPGLPEFGRWGYDFQSQFQTPLQWDEVKAEIDGGRPFAFSWTRTDPNTGASLAISHMMVVVGYNQGNGQRTLQCVNPRPFAPTEDLLIPYAEYVGNSGATATATATAAAPGSSHMHEYDYFGITPSP
jgi:peptidase C39-like protein